MFVDDSSVYMPMMLSHIATPCFCLAMGDVFSDID